MKKILCLLLILFSAFFSMNAGNITLSGRITNMAGQKLKLNGQFFSKEIELKPDGTFSESFDIEYPGSYTLATLNNKMQIYLVSDAKTTISADDNDFYNTVTFSGSNSHENQYLASKSSRETTLTYKELHLLDEQAFVKKLNEWNAASLAALNSNKNISENFKMLEHRNLKFSRVSYLNNYQEAHAYLSGQKDFIVSPEFPKAESITDLDNETDFGFSRDYVVLVWNEFRKRVELAAPETTSAYPSKIPLDIVKSFKSPLIRNSLLEGFSFTINTTNPNSEVVYNELMKEATSAFFKNRITESFLAIKELVPGKPSPQFDYENQEGGKTSLESMKGKYVYIDIWATWCAPCREEIPFLQSVTEQFKDKNITFVSISVDAKKDYEKWKKMVGDKQLGGIQLIADNELSSKFVKQYNVYGIPRFILIDPDGKIINSDAPRPSDPQLLNLLNSLKI
jgi:thiol-disulfide isomerase/thioredoxin